MCKNQTGTLILLARPQLTKLTHEDSNLAACYAKLARPIGFCLQCAALMCPIAFCFPGLIWDCIYKRSLHLQYTFPKLKFAQSTFQNANAQVHKDSFSLAMPYAEWSVYENTAVYYARPFESNSDGHK